MSRVRIAPSCLRDASYVVANMRPVDEEEILCQLPEGTKRHEFAYALIMAGESFVAYRDDLPVMLIGTTPMNVACSSIWAMGTKHTNRVLHAVTRFMLTEHLPSLIERGVITMEARSHVNHAPAHRWMRSTGAVVNGEPFVYGRDGEKFLTFQWHKQSLEEVRKRYRVKT